MDINFFSVIMLTLTAIGAALIIAGTIGGWRAPVQRQLSIHVYREVVGFIFVAVGFAGVTAAYCHLSAAATWAALAVGVAAGVLSTWWLIRTANNRIAAVAARAETNNAE